jgi:hypothetical protein
VFGGPRAVGGPIVRGSATFSRERSTSKPRRYPARDRSGTGKGSADEEERAPYPAPVPSVH